MIKTCKFCGIEDMRLKAVNDDPQLGYAYNIYICFSCMAICKEDVWKNKGQLWISKTNGIKFEK